MLLRKVVDKLDAELDRLQRLREIVAGLRGSLASVAPFVEVEHADAFDSITTEVKVQHIPPHLPREGRRTRRANAAEKAHTALTSAIPARPVVVSADALARENAARKHAPAAAPKKVEGTLGAMIRALGQQGAV